jgi:two-component system LytT family response regulator
MKPPKAIIIDDERNVREALSIMVTEYCPEISLAGTAASAEEGRALLDQHDVSVIFLDISMPKEDGFDFLNSIHKEEYRIIFVTAYEEYAIQALRASAIDYLLKPVNPTELCEAVLKALKFRLEAKRRKEPRSQFQNTLEVLHDEPHAAGNQVARINVTAKTGFKVLNVADIAYLEADDNHTIIHLAGLSNLTAGKTLGEFEKMLGFPEFFRIHKSYIINLNYLKSYISDQGNFVELSDGAILAISRRRLRDFRRTIKQYSKSVH